MHVENQPILYSPSFFICSLAPPLTPASDGDDDVTNDSFKTSLKVGIAAKLRCSQNTHDLHGRPLKYEQLANDDDFDAHDEN